MTRHASRTVCLPESPALPAREGAENTENTAAALPPARAVWAAQRTIMEREHRYRHPDGAHGRWRRRVVPLLIQALGWGVRAVGLYGDGKRNALTPRLNELNFWFPELPPAFDGFRILHLSDTHLDSLPELVVAAQDLLVGLSVDLVALTGDIHGRHHAPLNYSTELLAELLRGPEWRDRTVAVLGNHDPAAMADALAAMGIETLVNESRILERAEQRLILTGLDDVHYFYTPAALQALEQAPPGFRIALVHSAEVADHAAAAGYDLYLCGHTHGGQICLPGGRALFTPLKRCHFGARGEWRAGGMIGYTSHGLGVSAVPLRFNCRGEMTVITLRRTGAEV